MELTNEQIVAIELAMKKMLEDDIKNRRAHTDRKYLDMYRSDGAKSSVIALEGETLKAPLATVSVVDPEGSWQVTDLEAYRDGAEDAGLVEFRMNIDPYHIDAVSEALEAAGVRQWCQLEAKEVKDWAKECVEVAGRLVFKETGEPVHGVEFVPGKPYVRILPKSMELIEKATRAVFGARPMALLEGGQDA